MNLSYQSCSQDLYWIIYILESRSKSRYKIHLFEGIQQISEVFLETEYGLTTAPQPINNIGYVKSV